MNVFLGSLSILNVQLTGTLESHIIFIDSVSETMASTGSILLLSVEAKNSRVVLTQMTKG